MISYNRLTYFYNRCSVYGVIVSVAHEDDWLAEFVRRTADDNLAYVMISNTAQAKFASRSCIVDKISNKKIYILELELLAS